MSNLCIIPARGGSKRIPRKNIKNFFGKPIISYSIESAILSGIFDEVMVSTDDDEIKSISMEYGANVPFMRSDKSSNDFATTFDVIEEVVLNYKEQGINYEYVCCIYPCTPLLSINTLKESFNHLISGDFTSVFPVVKYSNPIKRALKFKNAKLEMLFPAFQDTRSQDLDEAYFDAGQFYWMKVDKILNCKNIYNEYSSGVVIDELNAQDIDNESDWELAKLKYKLINNK